MAGNLLRSLLPFALAALAAPAARAAHPLNTDDTGVQGAGNYQLELTLDRSRDREGPVVTRLRTFSATLSYGLTESADLVLGVPHLRTETDDPAAGPPQVERGAGDAGLQLKWKFHEAEGLSLAFKPAMTFRNGDANRGLGAGKKTYGALFIATVEREPWSWHFNLGYTRNNNLDPAAIRKNLFLGSVAFFHQTAETLRLVGDIGRSTNGDRHSGSHPAYLLGGLIYSPTKDLDLDLGVQFGANRVAEDRIYKVGVTIRW